MHGFQSKILLIPFPLSDSLPVILRRWFHPEKRDFHQLNWLSQQILRSEMLILSSLPINCSGFLHQSSTSLPFKASTNYSTRIDDHASVSLPSKTIYGMKIKYSDRNADRKHFGIGNRFAMSATKNDVQLSFDGDLPEEPFGLSLIKEIIWELKSLFVFLAEQPSQLKYIEWPSFSSTLRTATVTLVLVALIIVPLSSVDSLLSYLLNLVLRKSS
ncbi:hypothetical protein L6164_028941 [Bauhinia variegata]|uniref:Uncharacterized protein n=1 Tax=Bauhinia variegata TaxID=167791 RepID=A0ACB9L7H2_BAUVA|nr:hypothetical protein L6164_028941 [Bauhinia variegata]